LIGHFTLTYCPSYLKCNELSSPLKEGERTKTTHTHPEEYLKSEGGRRFQNKIVKESINYDKMEFPEGLG